MADLTGLVLSRIVLLNPFIICTTAVFIDVVFSFTTFAREPMTSSIAGLATALLLEMEDLTEFNMTRTELLTF